MSKGSNRRPGTGYANGYDGIDWGRKDYQIEIAGDTVFGLDPTKHYRTEVAKDGSVSYWEVGARQHVRDVAAQVVKETIPIGKLIPTVAERLRAARGVGHPHDFYQAEIAELRAALDAKTQVKPVRITGNFRCKVNGMDVLNDAGFEILTQPGFDYVLEAIEPQDKTCQHCKHWAMSVDGKENCRNEKVLDMLDSYDGAWLLPPADWGCNSWEAKV